jgi:hypothetical protein
MLSYFGPITAALLLMCALLQGKEWLAARKSRDLDAALIRQKQQEAVGPQQQAAEDERLEEIAPAL